MRSFSLRSLGFLCLGAIALPALSGCGGKNTNKGVDEEIVDAANQALEDCQDQLDEMGMGACLYCYNVVTSGATVNGTVGGVTVGGMNAGAVTFSYDAGDTYEVLVKTLPGGSCGDCLNQYIDNMATEMCEAESLNNYEECQCRELVDTCDPEDEHYSLCLREKRGYAVCDSMECTLTSLIDIVEGAEPAVVDEELAVCEEEQDAALEAACEEPAPLPPPPGAGPMFAEIPMLIGHHYAINDHIGAYNLLFNSDVAEHGAIYEIEGIGGRSVRLQFGALPDGSSYRDLGLMSGDIITHIDGQRVTTLVDAAQLLGTFEAGEVIPMRIRRNGETRLHRYHLN